jgi:Ni,Fe-hydrogenase III small subunit/ferredoxin
MDTTALTPNEALAAAEICPTTALTSTGDLRRGRLIYDIRQCVLCGKCVRAAPRSFHFTKDPRVAVSDPSRLAVQVSWAEDLKTDAPVEPDVEAVGRQLGDRWRRMFGHSLHIRHVDAGSCNGCESELQMLSSPYYDLVRLGFFFTPTPRHADALLVTGVVTRELEQPLRRTYEAMPEPKLVVAAGVCALGGGCFASSPLSHGPLDRILPVDVYVPGCPPTPLALLHGLLLAVGRAEQRFSAGGGADGD